MSIIDPMPIKAPMFVRGNTRHLPLADQSVHCIVTSPPYWGLRDYGLAPEVWGGDGSCDCPDHSPIPSTVLDPFGGAFTAPIVAAVLGRQGVGVEMKQEYIDIARRRWETGRERVINRVLSKVKKPKKRKQPASEGLFDLEVA